MPKFNIGEVITITTHPYASETCNIIISGEYQMIPPLMIIIEIIYGHLLSDEKSNPVKYKCIWFSTKDNLFKESYFVENELKSIGLETESNTKIIKIGDHVALTTQLIELGKKRSFLNAETQQNKTNYKSSVTSLLTYISPVMQVIDLNDFDLSKEKIPNKKITIIYPEKLVKCKWFNAVSEKFSECWIPLEALYCLPIISAKLLSLVQKSIEKKTYLKMHDLLVKPIQISNRSGHYYFEYFDYISQKIDTLPFTELIKPIQIKNPIKAFAPKFEKKTFKGKSILKNTFTVQKLIEKAILKSTKSYITITYKDKFEKISYRTISKYKIISSDGELESSGKPAKYVNAFCHLRNAERNFKLESILEAKELVIKY